MAPEWEALPAPTYAEDAPDDLKPVAIEHVIHRDWCGKRQKHIELHVLDALPKCQLGLCTRC
ncbi:hypothetical protein Pla108_07380 [Botrimarina colliarenosi]|uniref:Uncharacterized protein n=1 Tax=Botrimarina colliarenosi TaxID=2528001 RepID=A0A5C6AKU5_9BACT|nr:hypothetical protein [Botrimarina colliarenosi]TWT99795.1 hypothetical protein Pla108_07380 [Botrimarina colliarenosi]